MEMVMKRFKVEQAMTALKIPETDRLKYKEMLQPQ